MRRGLMLLLLTALLLIGLCAPALSQAVPDLSRTGAITASMRFDGAVVSGGTLTLYRVGEVRENDGSYSFAATGRFAESGVDFTNVESAALATELANFAAEKNLAGITQNIGSTGKVVFGDLEAGLYLMVQDAAAEGYNKAAPFLVSMPMLENGVYVYEVDASPKVELEKAPDRPDSPSYPDSKLPQTGQLKWPVPVLASCGVGLFVCGWVLKRLDRRSEHEK